MASHLASAGRIVKFRTQVPKTSPIPICCVCGLIRDNRASLDADRWVTKRTYEKAHGVNLAACHFTHTYCAGCFTDLMQRVKPSSRALAHCDARSVGMASPLK